MSLKRGDKGNQVRDLQKQLIALRRLAENGADGIFGGATEKAVRDFQKSMGLEVDGIVGPGTLNALRLAAPGAYVSSCGSIVLKLNSRGEDVKNLQKSLIELGYTCGSYGADGVFGAGTETAVKQFQSEHRLNPDGIVGAETWTLLNGAPRPHQKTNKGSGTLSKNSRGDMVKNLQRRLIQLGYSVGSYGADGVFGGGTETAVKQFQVEHGLQADGIVGTNTWAKLNNSATKPHQKPSNPSKPKTISDKEFLRRQSQMGFGKIFGTEYLKDEQEVVIATTPNMEMSVKASKSAQVTSKNCTMTFKDGKLDSIAYKGDTRTSMEINVVEKCISLLSCELGKIGDCTLSGKINIYNGLLNKTV